MYEDKYTPQITYAKVIEGQYKKNGEPKTEIADVFYNDHAAEFEQQLRAKLNELFDPTQPFARCPKQESGKVCEYCNFKPICNR